MKKLSFILLILGLIFSQIITFSFNLNNGVEFHSVEFSLLPIFGYLSQSTDLTLSSTILGYIAYIVFGVINTNKLKAPTTYKSTLMFTGIAIVVTFFEFTSILEDLYGNYQGKYFKIGWLIFLLGLWIFSKKYLAKK